MMRASSTFLGVLVLATGWALAGCATIVSDSKYPVVIASTPSGASFVLRDDEGAELFSGTTPETILLESGSGYFGKAQYEVTFTLAGHQETKARVGVSMDGWYFGNVLLGGLIGFLIVDPLTGAMWKLEDRVLTTLQPITP